MNLIILVTAYLIIKYFFYYENILDNIIALFVVFLTLIVLILQLLGILNILYLKNLIILSLSLLFSVFLLIKIRDLKPKLNFCNEIGNALERLRIDKLVIFCFSIIFAFGLVKIFINLMNPPFGWDSLNYHFTFPVEWFKQGNLVNPIVVSCDPSPTYYPINGSLFFFWFILPLKNVFIADLGQVPFFIIAFLIVFSLARKLNLSKEYALFSASIFTLIPNYLKQLEIAYVDIMVGAFFLISVNYLFLFYKERSIKNAILYFITLGLMAGTKSIALPYIVILLIPFLYCCFSKITFKKSLFLLIAGAFFIALLGGFSYIRNFIQTGNPLYPVNINFLSKGIFRGVIEKKVLYGTSIQPKDYSLSKILFSEGLGAQTILFLLPAIFLGLPVSITKRRKTLDFNLIYFMVLPILLILTYRFIIPLANLRYLYSVLGICSIIAFYIIGVLNLPKLIIKILITVCVLASIAELAGHLELVISLTLSLILFFALSYLLRFMKTKKIFKYAVFILIVLYFLLIFLEKDYIRNEYDRYIKMVDYSGFWPDATKAWAWLNQNTTGNNIAYIGRPVPFPLYGTDFKNNVYYVSVNKTEPAKLHYFPDSKYVWGYEGEGVHKSFEKPNNYRGNADYNTWLNNLRRRNTDYLFVYSLHQIKSIEFPLEDKWSTAHPDIFALVYKNDTIHIYKIIR